MSDAMPSKSQWVQLVVTIFTSTFLAIIGWNVQEAKQDIRQNAEDLREVAQAIPVALNDSAEARRQSSENQMALADRTARIERGEVAAAALPRIEGNLGALNANVQSLLVGLAELKAEFRDMRASTAVRDMQ